MYVITVTRSAHEVFRKCPLPFVTLLSPTDPVSNPDSTCYSLTHTRNLMIGSHAVLVEQSLKARKGNSIWELQARPQQPQLGPHAPLYPTVESGREYRSQIRLQ